MAATVLIIDDHPMVRHMVQTILEHAGYHVLTAAEGDSGLELYERLGADAAIVDVDMPGLIGPDVCRELARRAQRRGQPLVLWLMTGVVRPELPDEVRGCGALGVLSKPFTRGELLACLEEHGVHARQHAFAT